MTAAVAVQAATAVLSKLGPINMKRAVANHCKEVTADLEGSVRSITIH